MIMAVLILSAGCSIFKTNVEQQSSTTKWFEKINWDAVTAYWKTFVKGLKVTTALVNIAAGDVKIDGVKISDGITTIVNPLLDKADSSVTALVTVAAKLQAGTVSVTDAEAALTQVKNDVIAANAVVGQLDEQAKTVNPTK